MTTYRRVHVHLSKQDRRGIDQMLRKGQESARVLRRASILRHLDQGQRTGQVAANVGVDRKAVRAIARRYKEEGWVTINWKFTRKSGRQKFGYKRNKFILSETEHPQHIRRAIIEERLSMMLGD